MAARAAERRRVEEEPATYDPVVWRKSNVVFGADGAILYPADMPCTSCGLETDGLAAILDHAFERDVAASEENRDEICTCGWHESYHRPHDCAKDYYEPIACACVGGQPWSCCVNRYARREQFMLQKVANTLRAAVEKNIAH